MTQDRIIPREPEESPKLRALFAAPGYTLAAVLVAGYTPPSLDRSPNCLVSHE
jgi:hypothetical protein